VIGLSGAPLRLPFSLLRKFEVARYQKDVLGAEEVLMRYSVIGLILVLVCCCSASALAQSDWITFAPPDEQFTVQLPQNPQVKIAAGAFQQFNIDGHLYSVRN